MKDKNKSTSQAGAAVIVGLLAGVFAMAYTPSAWAAAAFTSVNEAVDGAGHCQNGNPGVNCNHYDGKEFVWLNGGSGPSGLGAGTYFFAVLAPGGQPTPNDGGAKNLSDDTDAYTNRRFSIDGSGNLSYGGTHNFDSNKIRVGLAPAVVPSGPDW